MASKIQYPLEQVALIKKRRLDEAERFLKAKKEELAKEEAKLVELEKDRDKVRFHKDTKLQQLRDELDTGTTTDKIQLMKRYLKEVDEKLKQKEVKVKDQKKKVDSAKEVVEAARKDMLKKQQEVEKMNLHRKEWEKEQKAYLELQSAIEMDEIGTVIHNKRKREGNH